MSIEIKRQSLSNIQLELLKLFSQNIPESDLFAIKQMLANYFASKAEQEMEKFWDEKQLQPEDMDSWAKEHNRSHS